MMRCVFMHNSIYIIYHSVQFKMLPGKQLAAD